MHNLLPYKSMKRSNADVFLADRGSRVRSDYLTAFDGEQKMLESRGRPVAVYTYRMSFSRVPDAAGIV